MRRPQIFLIDLVFTYWTTNEMGDFIIFFGLFRIYENYHESTKIEEKPQLRWNKNCSFKKDFTLFVKQKICIYGLGIFSPGTQVTLGHNLVPKFLLSNCLLLGLSFCFVLIVGKLWVGIWLPKLKIQWPWSHYFAAVN